MSKGYQNLSKKAGMELANLLSENCQIILPMVELIETPGRSTVEAVLLMSAADVAGERHQGRKGETCCGTAARPGWWRCRTGRCGSRNRGFGDEAKEQALGKEVEDLRSQLGGCLRWWVGLRGAPVPRLIKLVILKHELLHVFDKAIRAW